MQRDAYVVYGARGCTLVQSATLGKGLACQLEGQCQQHSLYNRQAWNSEGFRVLVIPVLLSFALILRTSRQQLLRAHVLPANSPGRHQRLRGTWRHPLTQL